MKKGFTLIELLAVIVILAIIALIATPIVLSIIDDSKESAMVRSAEGYLRAVEYEVAQAYVTANRITEGTFDILPGGNICIDGYSNNTCTGNILEIEYNNEGPISGSITFEDTKIKTYTLTYSSGITIVDGRVSDDIINPEDNLPALAKAIVTKAKTNNYYYTTTPDFSYVTVDGEHGLYSALDDYGTSYYFRGDTENNYVQFGTSSFWKLYYDGDFSGEYESVSNTTFISKEACESSDEFLELDERYGAECRTEGEEALMYWRIIRINGDGTIRMIYDGIEKAHNGVAHTATIANKSFSLDGSAGDSCTYPNNNYIVDSNYLISEDDDETNSEHPSHYAFYQNDKWFNNNLNAYVSVIEDRIFCNELTKNEWQDEPVYDETGYFIVATYIAYDRLFGENISPSLTCSVESRHTVRDENGNGVLSNPIALINVDEMILAGNKYGENNTTNYLFSGEDYWSMTPSFEELDNCQSLIFYVNSSGSISHSTSGSLNAGVRPVINLKADVKFTGDGSFDNPYVIITE